MPTSASTASPPAGDRFIARQRSAEGGPLQQHPVGRTGLTDRLGAARHGARGPRHDEPGLLLIEFPPGHRQTVGPVGAGRKQFPGIGRERSEIGAGRGGHAQHGAVEETDCHRCHIISPKENGRVVEPQMPPHVSGMQAAARGIGRRPLGRRA
ncbi:hypothetical protein ACQPZZ_25525 [Microbispora sp. CA-135349]|uniref:hypothetical protein n=1 Tax=Microbispora sp. CA-135349 TaxID=3239953 RepID=UPI003D8B5EC0